MKEIKLTRGMTALVDDEDFEWLNQWKWFAHKGTDQKTYYAGRDQGYKCKPHQIWMHRVIMNTPPELQVDHIDHDGLNNQKHNLRNCTHHQNHMNLSNYGVSKYKGVSFFKNNHPKRVRASITLNNNIIYLGVFYTEEEAARAYDKKAKELFGEFANLNFPDSLQK